jgi:hypothetical protein
MGGRFDYGPEVSNAGRRFGCGTDILTMGWMIWLQGSHFDCGADISTAGCVHCHWDGCFDYGAGASTVGWMFRLQGV